MSTLDSTPPPPPPEESSAQTPVTRQEIRPYLHKIDEIHHVLLGDLRDPAKGVIHRVNDVERRLGDKDRREVFLVGTLVVALVGAAVSFVWELVQQVAQRV